MGRDGSGNRVIDGVGLARFTREQAVEDERGAVGGGPPTSVRNAYTGIVTALTVDDVVAQVEIQAAQQRGPEIEAVVEAGQVAAGEVLDALDPVVDGVDVQVQDLGRAGP